MEMKAEVGTHGAPTEYKKGKLLACTWLHVAACGRVCACLCADQWIDVRAACPLYLQCE
jgi:hypothetical protein